MITLSKLRELLIGKSLDTLNPEFRHNNVLASFLFLGGHTYLGNRRLNCFLLAARDKCLDDKR